MSYGKRVQLETLFDPRQVMSTIQSLEIELTPVLIDGQEIVSDALCGCHSLAFRDSFSPKPFRHNFHPHSQYASIWPERLWKSPEVAHRPENDNPFHPAKSQPHISKNNSIKIPMLNECEPHKNPVRLLSPSPFVDRSKLRTRLGKTPNNTLSLWRDISANNEHTSATSLPLFYSFVTDNKQCLATSYMSSKGHCCLCQFTAINNDMEVLIKHLSYCHPRFTASMKVRAFFPH